MALFRELLLTSLCALLASAKYCKKLCDEDSATRIGDTRTASDHLHFHNRKLMLVISDPDNVAYVRVENGEPQDSIWIDHSFDGGAKWEGPVVKTSIPEGAREVNSPVINIDNDKGMGILRACGNARNTPDTPCTLWHSTLVCRKFCDYGDSNQISKKRNPSDSLTFHSRKLTLFVSDSDNVAYGRIENGEPGDELWLDRSFNGGDSWHGGALLGMNSIKKGETAANSFIMNIDSAAENRKVGVVRVCGRAGSNPVACTKWVRTLICGKYCDGDDSKLIATKHKASETKVHEGRKIKLYISDEDNVAFAGLEGGKPDDDIWMDRSYDGGHTWWGNGLLGNTKVPKNGNAVNTTLFNIDGNFEGRKVGIIRACANVHTKEGSVACTEWRRTMICDILCDGEDSNLALNTRTVAKTELFWRKISIVVSFSDNVTYGRIENGSPTDEVWLDRSFDDGASWDGGARLGYSRIPDGSRGVNTPLYNLNSKLKNRPLGVVRACGKAGNRNDVACTSWARTLICSRYCDGDDSLPVGSMRKAATTEIFRRKISLYISDTDNAAFGKIDNGDPTDEVWMDRSWDGGKTISGGSRLGYATTPKGSRGAQTGLYNVDVNGHVGVVRTCGKAGNRDNIACTEWTRALPRTLICGKFCDGDSADKASNVRLAFTVELLPSRISIVLSDDDNVAYAKIENGNPGDEIWVDRSWNGGRSWYDGNRLGSIQVADGEKEAVSSIANIDGNYGNGHIGVVRACGKSEKDGNIVCTGWTRTQVHGKTPIEAAVTSMMMDYNEKGLWETTGWWNSANCLTSLIDYIKVTGDKTFLYAIDKTYEKNKNEFQGNFCSDNMDDSGWWGLAWVAAYDVKKDKKYLDTAKIIADYMYQNSDKKCNGGIYMSSSKTAKNAITNELFIKLAASIHNRLPDATPSGKYLTMAKEVWDWFKSSGIINNENLVNEGLSDSCHNNGGITWTHTQGALIGALNEMNKATGKKRYLDQAVSVADAVIRNSYLSPNGILHEPLDSTGKGPSNKGVFARNLGELNIALEDRPYSSYIYQNAKMIFQNRNSLNQYGLHYEGPYRFHSAASQHSALDMFIADRRN